MRPEVRMLGAMGPRNGRSRVRRAGRSVRLLSGRWVGSRVAFLAGLLFLPSLPASAQTSLTIYNDGRVLERRAFPVAVPAGVSTHRIAVGPIDLASLFALDEDMVVAGAVYDAATDEANTLRRALGRPLAFLAGLRTNGVRDTVLATVVGVDPERFELADGRITFQRPGTPAYPPDLVLLAPAASVTVRAARARSGLRLGYFTSGAVWQAAYTVTLGGATARIAGHAVVRAGPLRVDSAEVQLLAGTVSRAGPARDEGIALRMVAAEAAAEQQVGESHLYTLPGRLSFTPGLETSAMLFEPAAAPVTRDYVVRGRVPFRGPLPQYGDELNEPVFVTYTLERRARSGFGDLPLPAGVARVYQADAAGRPQLIGEASVGHTAAGRSVTLDAGQAFDLTAVRTQTSYSTRRDSLRTQALADFSVALANAKDSAVTIDVLESRAGEWAVLASSVPAERVSSTTARFRVRVPARGEATLTYRIRVVW